MLQIGIVTGIVAFFAVLYISSALSKCRHEKKPEVKSGPTQRLAQGQWWKYN